ncbi:helix-turn-helix transcriptional regulator [Paenibacillus abyssi]|uniref:HTH araC/xylS-type domain-containing protein n=1 Tax=Paenibacillus abyssi TaxID=1340531 RepID=A0A917LEZ3_9BACL|nr:AraC family transcriptional regulator [Paenibacillus abyssi]GGG17220.1 hypothetical protein GCM10010916_37600 [Paenibacillus abyssi]
MPSIAAAVHPAGTAGFDKRYLERAITLSHVTLYQVRDWCGYELEGRSTAQAHLLIYMLSGNGMAAVDGHRVHLPQRHFIRVEPGRSYRIDTAERSNEAMRLVSVEVQPVTGSKRLAAVFQSGTDSQAIHDTAGMDELFFELMQELQIHDRYTQTMLDSLINRMIVQMGRLIDGAVSTANGKQRVLNKKELVYQTVQYIDRHIEHIDELGQVAEELGYSYSHLSHAFRAEMGVPLQVYWVKRRMMRAMNRLQTGRCSITQISEDLSYQSIHSFSKAFKKVTGFTPSEYQSLYGKGSGYR